MKESDGAVEAGHLKPYGALPVPWLTPELMTLARTGRVYSLGVVYRRGMPAVQGMVSYTRAAAQRHGEVPADAPISGAYETISMATHVGTHIDALIHIGEWDGAPGEAGAEVRVFGGPGETMSAVENDSPEGHRRLSIAEMPPIVARAVLFDVAGCLEMDVLPPGYEITVADLEATAAWQGGTRVVPGTAVLIRTGCYRYFAAGDQAAFNRDIPGIGLEAARWLLDRGAILEGADSLTVERVPPAAQPVHRLMLVHSGVTHLEVLYLDELAADRAYEFLLVAAPLRLYGSTGSWINPIAIA